MEALVNFLERVLKAFGVKSNILQFLLVKPHPTLTFHKKRGRNIAIDEKNGVAHRVTDYQYGMVFSNRPIALNEQVCIKIIKRNTKWHGPLCFGFTNVNPAWLETDQLERARIMQYRYWPDFWFNGLYNTSGTFLIFWMNSNGEVVFRVDNGDEVVISAELIPLSTTEPLWAAIDVYGSFSAIQLVSHPMLTKVNPTPGTTTNFPEPVFISQYNRNDDSNVFSFDFPASSSNIHLNRSTTFSYSSGSFSQSSPLLSPFSPKLGDYSTPNPDFQRGMCVICLERLKTTAFTDCGHLCCCFECAQQYWNVEMGQKHRCCCPVCRQSVKSYLRIY